MPRRRILGDWAIQPRFKRPRGYLIRPLSAPKLVPEPPSGWTELTMRKFGIVLDLMIESAMQRDEEEETTP